MEQRLIDGNELFGIVSLLNSDIVKANPVARWLIQQVLHDIGAMPTINPEDLPIVKRLREKLAKVTAEKDAAYMDLKLIGEECLCSVCSHYNEPDLFCYDCKGRPYIATDTFEWRGPQKEE